MPILIRGSGGRSLKLQPKEVTPTESQQTITPDSAHDGLSRVVVNRIPTSYVKPSRTLTAKTYTPSTSPQTISAGTYCSGTQTIQGDSDLVASNIKSGVSIFGVTGTYKGEQDSDLIPGNIKSGVNILGVTGTYKGEQDSDLIPGNIKSGVEILGVTGTYEGEGAVFGSVVTGSSNSNPTFQVNTNNLKGFYLYADGDSLGEEYEDSVCVFAGFYYAGTFKCMAIDAYGWCSADNLSEYGGTISVNVNSNTITITHSNNVKFNNTPKIIPIY